jgi:hypothetical protein
MKIPSSSTRCQRRPATGKRLGATASIDVAVLGAQSLLRAATNVGVVSSSLSALSPSVLRWARRSSHPRTGWRWDHIQLERLNKSQGSNYTSNLHPDLLASAETDPLAWSSTGIESQLLVFNVRFSPPRFPDGCAIMLVRDPALGSWLTAMSHVMA